MTVPSPGVDPVPHALYRFFDSNGRLLYVGLTFDPSTRWRAHRRLKTWWLEVANITIEHHENRADVEDAEIVAIKSERPRYNVIHQIREDFPCSSVPTQPRSVSSAPPAVKDWFSVGEGAQRLGISREILRRAADRREIVIDGEVFPLRVVRVGPAQHRRIAAADIARAATRPGSEDIHAA